MWIKVAQSTPMENNRQPQVIQQWYKSERQRKTEDIKCFVTDGDVFPKQLRNINYDTLIYQVIVKCTFKPNFQIAHVVLKLRFCKTTKKIKNIRSKWFNNSEVISLEKPVIQLITEKALFIVAAFNVQLHVYVMVSWCWYVKLEFGCFRWMLYSLIHTDMKVLLHHFNTYE